MSDSTGLRPDGACGGASSSCNGGTETWTKSKNGWDWSYTKAYHYSYSDGSSLALTVTTRRSNVSYRVNFKTGPNPAPVKKGGVLSTNVLGHAAGIEYGLLQVSDLANPFCWVADSFCSATEKSKKEIDEWAESAGADTDSGLYGAAADNDEQAPLLALGGGRFPEGEFTVVAAAKVDVEGLSMTRTVEKYTRARAPT